MNQPFRRDQPDTDAVKRTRALDYGIDQIRRGASALTAAAHGEPREMRLAVLEDVHRRLESIVRELQALQ